MSTQDNDPAPHSDDAAFDDYLRRSSTVSQHYRSLDADAVPPSLDHAVLSQARAAVSATKRSRLVRWSAPLALAASVVVVVSLVMLPAVQQEVSRSAVPASAPATRAVPLEYSLPAPEKKTSATEEESPVGIKPPQQMQTAPELSILEESAVAAPKAQQEQSTAEHEIRERVVADASKRAASQVERVAAAPPPPVQLDTFAAPATAVRQTTSAAPAPAQNARPGGDAALGVTAVEPQIAGNAAADRSGEVSESRVTANRAQHAPAQGAGPRGTVPPDSEQRASRNEAALMKAAREEDAPRWLEYIRQLRRDGDARAADRQWQRFIARYPDLQVDAQDQARPQK